MKSAKRQISALFFILKSKNIITVNSVRAAHVLSIKLLSKQLIVGMQTE